MIQFIKFIKIIIIQLHRSELCPNCHCVICETTGINKTLNSTVNYLLNVNYRSELVKANMLLITRLNLVELKYAQTVNVAYKHHDAMKMIYLCFPRVDNFILIPMKNVYIFWFAIKIINTG